MATMIAEIIISLLAVFGLYAAVRLLCGLLFAPRQLVDAIVIDGDMSEDDVVYLVWRAREGSFDGKRRLIALLPVEKLGSQVIETLLALGVECYQINEEKEG